MGIKLSKQFTYSVTFNYLPGASHAIWHSVVFCPKTHIICYINISLKESDTVNECLMITRR